MNPPERVERVPLKRAVVWALCLLAYPMSAPAYGADGRVKLDTALANPIVLADGPQKTYLKVALTGGDITATERAPVNIALVLDRSGSMAGERMARAKDALVAAINRLGPRDVVSVVVYDTTVRVLVPATRLRDREAVIRSVRDIDTGDRTALFAGVAKGAGEVRKFLERTRVNRVILVSDGLANVGPGSPAELGDLGRSLGSELISVTTIGIGQGYNEDLLVKLAANSDGNHAFAESPEALAAIFGREFSDVLSVVAQQVRIRIRLAPRVRPIRVLGHSGEVIGQEVWVDLNSIYSHQEKYAVLEVEIPEGPAGSQREVAEVLVDYADLLDNARPNLKQSVRVAYAASAGEVDTNINPDAMNSATFQVINDNIERAIELRDRGDKAKALELIEYNFRHGENNFVGDGDDFAEIYGANVRALNAVADDAYWGKGGRKTVREDVHRNATQQADYRSLSAVRAEEKESQ